MARRKAKGQNGKRPSTRVLLKALRASHGFDTLDKIDRRLLEMVVARPNVSVTDLGTLVHRHRTNVSVRINRPAFKAAVETAQLDALGLAETFRRKAIERLAQLMDTGETDHVRLRAALFFAFPVQPVGGPTDTARDFEKFLIEADRQWRIEYDAGRILPPGPDVEVKAEES